MKRTEREMRKKHALELKQQPKSLKVSVLQHILFRHFFLWNTYGMDGLSQPSNVMVITQGRTVLIP